MRALKAATVVMGVLILVGTAVLVAAMVKRATAPAPTQAGAGSVPSAVSLAAIVHEPPGSRIATLVAAGDVLALSIQGGGPDRIVLIDPRTGEVRGRIALAP